MKQKALEIWEELKSVLSGKTFDTVLPPLAFVLVNAVFGLVWAAISAMTLAVFLGVRRVILKQSLVYALVGLVVVALASGLAWLTQNAKNYFLPGLVSSGLFLFVILISLLIDKPLVAWISHLTRKWPLAWFWRKDVRPAYREATWIWAVLFSLRLAVQLSMYLQEEPVTLFWVNLLLGWPLSLIILIASYIYGIWRLHRLGGPGVQEFVDEKQPPWEGQKKGF